MLPLKGKPNGAPKKVLNKCNAFMQIFCKEIMKKLPEEEKKSLFKINKAFIEAYHVITKKQEELVKEYIIKDKERYEDQRLEFNKRGYYTMNDGTRSIDQKAVKSSKKSKSGDKSSKISKEDGNKKSGTKKLRRKL